MNNWISRLSKVLRGPAELQREEAARHTLTLLRWLEEQLERERAEVTRERAATDRLKEENRALLNSLLGTAGVPPVETPRPTPQGISAVRRRTWPQIASTREIEAARQSRAKENQ
jgi:hypothetical protein